MAKNNRNSQKSKELKKLAPKIKFAGLIISLKTVHQHYNIAMKGLIFSALFFKQYLK